MSLTPIYSFEYADVWQIKQEDKVTLLVTLPLINLTKSPCLKTGAFGFEPRTIRVLGTSRYFLQSATCEYQLHMLLTTGTVET